MQAIVYNGKMLANNMIRVGWLGFKHWLFIYYAIFLPIDISWINFSLWKTYTEKRRRKKNTNIYTPQISQRLVFYLSISIVSLIYYMTLSIFSSLSVNICYIDWIFILLLKNKTFINKNYNNRNIHFFVPKIYIYIY